jgi:hypothetical protein
MLPGNIPQGSIYVGSFLSARFAVWQYNSREHCNGERGGGAKRTFNFKQVSIIRRRYDVEKEIEKDHC